MHVFIMIFLLVFLVDLPYVKLNIELNTEYVRSVTLHICCLSV